MSTRKFLSGAQSRQKRKREDSLAISQKVAMERFLQSAFKKNNTNPGEAGIDKEENQNVHNIVQIANKSPASSAREIAQASTISEIETIRKETYANDTTITEDPNKYSNKAEEKSNPLFISNERRFYALDISLDKDCLPVQPKLHSFPKTLIGGKNRGFNSSWYDKNKMLEYSVMENKVYCFCCRHFLNGKNTGFIDGFSDWKNLAKKFEDHFTSNKSIHQQSYAKYLEYLESKSRGSIACQINDHHKLDVSRNRDVLSAHVEIIILCAQQDLALRGHRSNEIDGNRGNFVEILDLLKRKCPDLRAKCDSMPNNAKYLHSTIQNELINISGNLVRRMIVQEVNEFGGLFSVIADETRDSAGVEQLSVCIRYTTKSDVVERFLGYTDLHKFDSESISQAIINLVTESGLKMKNCVAQTYDGASVMSGHLNGVRVKIEAVVGGNCPYVHCYAHRLNLVLVDCCSNILAVRELLGLIQAIYNFQSNSVIRSEYFESSQRDLGYDVILKMPQSCNTRWWSKKKGLYYFRSRFNSVVLALENLIENGKPEEAAECRGYLSQLNGFNNLILIVALDEVLEITNSLSVYLQSPKVAFTEAVAICQATVASLEEIRTSERFDFIWNEASKLAASAFIQVPDPNSEPLTKRKMIPNKRLKHSIITCTTGSRLTESTTLIVKMRSTYYELIDKFILEMKKRLLENADLFKGITASDPHSENFLKEDDILAHCETYNRFDFDLDSLKGQLKIARNLVKSQNLNNVTDCFRYFIALEDGFPDLVTYYKIVLCIPVANTISERSFSSLNRIETRLRTTMGEDRLSNLATLSINRDLSNYIKDNPLLVVDEFGKNCNRRVTFID